MMVLSTSATASGQGKRQPRTEGISFMSATIHRSVSGATLADCEAQLEPGETIVHTVGSRVTGSVVCQVAAAPEASAVAEKVSESTNRQKLEALSAEAADLATAMSQRGDTEGSFYARGLRDAYAIAAAFWSGSEVTS